MKGIRVIEKREIFAAVRFDAGLYERLRGGEARELSTDEDFVYHRIRKFGEGRYWYDDPGNRERPLLVMSGNWVLVGNESGKVRFVDDLSDYQEVP